MEQEIWKDIEGYEGLYQISNLGEVKALPRNINNQFKNKEYNLKKIINKDGYYVINLKNSNHKNKIHRINRLVAMAFIPNPENKLQVNHIDGNKKNNKVENLEWCTAKENKQHAQKNGLIRKKTILKLDLNGNVLQKYETVREASELNNLDYTTIIKCCNGKCKTCGGYKWRNYDESNI